MRAFVAALIVSLAGVQSAGAADAVWTLAIAGRRDVVLSMRMGPEGTPSADAHLLAPDLSLAVASREDGVAIRDVNGVEWQTSNGSARLDGPFESRALAVPVQVVNDAVFMPLDAIAALAGRKLVLADGGRAFLLLMPAPRAALPSAPSGSAASNVAAAGDTRGPVGWESFQLPKTADERAASLRDADDLITLRERRDMPEILPDAHEAVGIDLGLGFAQGGGAAIDATGSGSFAGYRIGLAGFITASATSATFRSGRLAVESPSGAWTAEAGDVLSEMRGLARGVRVSRRVTSRWRPGVSFYVDDSRVAHDRAAIAYRDDLLITRNLDVRGEASTDGSHFVALRVIAGRGNIETFHRYAADRQTTDRGISASYNVGFGVSAYGGLRLSDNGGNEQWRMMGVAFPLVRGSSVSVERTQTDRPASSDVANAFGLQLPFGPVRVMQRYTWTDIALVDGPSGLAAGRRQLQSMATYSPTSRVRFTYQLGTQWYAGTDARQWTELETSVRAWRGSSVHAVTGFPAVNDTQRFRVGVQQALPRAFRLSIDYGHLPVFESTTPLAPQVSRLLVMVRRNWAIRTPAAGTDVEGVVRDDSGAPVAGAAVSLGRYVTTTGEDGHYRFAHVPAGDHALAVLREHLPAAFAVAAEPRIVTVGADANMRADLGVTALRAIHGRVFLDRNGNGLPDDDEGVSGVVVRLDDSGAATLTGPAGQFDFYNLDPRRYAVWVDPSRLRTDLELASAGRLTIDVQPDHAATDVNFQVAVHDRPILMKELP